MHFRFFPAVIIFFCCLGYFVYGTGWYDAAHLEIRGNDSAKNANLEVRWDSGSGYNRYESERFIIKTVAPDHGMHKVTIRALGEKNPDSESSAVELTAVYLDGKEFKLSSVMPRSILHDRLAIHLTEKDQVYEFSAPATKNIRLELSCSYYFGKAEITVDGRSGIFDFFTPEKRLDPLLLDYWIMNPDGNFAVSMDLPRYRIKELIIENKNPNATTFLKSITLQGDGNISSLPVDENSPFRLLVADEPNRNLKKYFHPSQLFIQFSFSILTTWMILVCYQFIRRRGGVRNIFREEKRYVFWSLLLGAITVYSLWLAAFWPGVMSIDSLKIWRAAAIPGLFINDHPVLNMLFYMYLMHFWNNIAVVPATQVFLASLLIAYAFFMLYRRGVSLPLLLPFYLLIVFSIPVGLYNTVLWKDIPFALLVVFWGITLIRLNGKRGEELAHLPVQEVLALFLLYLALGLIRHNGIVYLFVLPVFLLVIWPVRRRTVVMTLLSCLCIAGGTLVLFMHPPRFVKNSFLYRISHGYLKEVKEIALTDHIVQSAGDYFAIFDMEKEGAKSDRFQSYLNDRFAYNFLRRAGFNDFYPYIGPHRAVPSLEKAAIKLYEKSYQKPWYTIVWNPVFMLTIIPLTVLLYRWLPNAAIYGGFLLTGALALVFLQIFNWRYYYFYYFGLYFVLPIIFLDIKFHAVKKA